MDLHFSKEFLSQTSSEESLAHFWAHRRSLHIDGAEEMVSLRVLRLPIDCLMANYLDIVYDTLIEGSTIFLETNEVSLHDAYGCHNLNLRRSFAIDNY